MTKTSIFSIFNAAIMVVFAIPNLLLVLKYKIRESKDVVLKVFLILFYAYPAFLLCLLRLLKEKGCLISQISRLSNTIIFGKILFCYSLYEVVSVSFNDGQKVCNQNYFTGKYPLGKSTNITVKVHF